ncbi:MAG: TetR family transcriptional regulator [bacterium]|nr:TetR family transcriptional regulator [bacterium]
MSPTKTNKPKKHRPEKSETKLSVADRAAKIAEFREFLERFKSSQQITEPDSPRARILDTAFTLFAEKGFHGVGVREIAVAAKVNQAMVHYYFQTKEQLYHRVIATQMVNIAQFILMQLDLKHTPEEMILSLPRRITNMLQNHPKWSQLILREVAEGGKHLAETVNELGELGPRGISKQLALLYGQSVASGNIIDLPPAMAVPLLIGFSYSAAFIEPFFRVISQSEGESEKLNEMRITLMEHLWRCGMTTPMPRGKKHAAK